MSQFDFEIELMKIYIDIEKFSCRYNLQKLEQEDLFHETILKILEKRHMFKIDGEYNLLKFRSWCYTIMNNIFINNYRVNQRHNVNSYDENPLLLFDNEPTTFNAEEEFLSKELYEIIVKTEKNEINRKIFFGFMNGISYESLAEIFNLPCGTIKSKLFHTRRKIKQVLLNNKI